MNQIDTQKVQDKLHQIETAIIERMAQKIGVHPSQVETDIKVIPEYGKYYRRIRAQVIAAYAKDCTDKLAEVN